MDEQRIRKLEAAGVFYGEGIKRFSGKTMLYEKFLLKFKEDQSYSCLQKALEEEDVAAAFSAAHNLKGVTGNLSLNNLYYLLIPFVEILRSGEIPCKVLWQSIEEEYERIIKVLG